MRITCVAQLQVIVPPTSPEIIVQPSGDLCPAGYAFNLQVGAVGEVPLHYQWMFNDLLLPIAINATLSFSAVEASNAGTYSVIVSNHIGLS